MPFYNNHCCGFGACSNYNYNYHGCNRCNRGNYYYDNGNCNQRYIPIPGPQGPVGPQGPQGPQGIMGPSGATDSLYANATAVTLTGTTGLIPITFVRATTGTTITVSGNTVIVPAGTYLVTYNYTATPTDAGNIIVQLLQGGAAIDTITQTVTPDETINGSSTLLITTTGDTTLGLNKGDTNTITYDKVNLTVTKVQ